MIRTLMSAASRTPRFSLASSGVVAPVPPLPCHACDGYGGTGTTEGLSGLAKLPDFFSGRTGSAITGPGTETPEFVSRAVTGSWEVESGKLVCKAAGKYYIRFSADFPAAGSYGAQYCKGFIETNISLITSGEFNPGGATDDTVVTECVVGSYIYAYWKKTQHTSSYSGISLSVEATIIGVM